ncbi:MAG: ATP-grasp domain-containing protein [Nitrosomonadales bacterium]|nr:ATP-grasp domain-containing protein [Nitrosomonadales bacterium]
MKIFVCEYITSGGLYREALTNRLLREGLLMRDALLADLAELKRVEVICAYDCRLPAPLVSHVISVSEQDDIWQVWSDLISQSDAVWLIAPESAGILLELTEVATAQGKLIIGCPSSVVSLTTSKLDTYHALLHAGIPAVPTYSAEQWLAKGWQDDPDISWVIKPNDGVSCDDTVYRNSSSEVAAWIEQGRRSSHIVQPRCLGDAASLSMLCIDGQAWLLSCNRQKVIDEAGQFVYEGSVVNGFSGHWEVCNQLAQKVARSLPDMAGYVGVDLMVMDGDQVQLEVLEINPRLTTSYVGLSAATGLNVAEMILNLFDKYGHESTAFYCPEIAKNIVEITL